MGTTLLCHGSLCHGALGCGRLLGPASGAWDRSRWALLGTHVPMPAVPWALGCGASLSCASVSLPYPPETWAWDGCRGALVGTCSHMLVVLCATVPWVAVPQGTDGLWAAVPWGTVGLCLSFPHTHWRPGCRMDVSGHQQAPASIWA